nr:MAG TPA: hypothetical protein [Caudoviricetes sp.]
MPNGSLHFLHRFRWIKWLRLPFLSSERFLAPLPPVVMY